MTQYQYYTLLASIWLAPIPDTSWAINGLFGLLCLFMVVVLVLIEGKAE